MSTTKKTTTKPAGAKAPQDRKPKATKTKAKAETPAGIVEVTLEGMDIRADLSHARNIRLMRRMKKGDLDAVIQLMELIFGDQVDEVEAKFDLVTDDDWGNFITRVVQEAENPNS